MKNNSNTILNIIMIVVFIVGFFFIRKPLEDANQIMSRFDDVTKIVDDIQIIQKDYIALQEERDKTLIIKIDSLNDVVENLTASVNHYQNLADENAQKTNELLAQIEPRPEEPPEDFEECTQQLELAHQREDILVEVVDNQEEEITSLRSVNHSQGIIIENKDRIIKVKDSQIEAWKQVADDERRKGNIKAIISAGVVYGILKLL